MRSTASIPSVRDGLVEPDLRLVAEDYQKPKCGSFGLAILIVKQLAVYV